MGHLPIKDNWGDLMFCSGLAGAVSSGLKTLAHHAFVWTGVARSLYFQVNAFLIHGHSRVKSLSDVLFAVLGDLTVGAMLGVLLGILLHRTSPKYHLWMGLGAGVVIWFGSLALGNLTRIIKPAQTDPVSLLALLVGMEAYGLLFVLFSRAWKPLRSFTTGIRRT